MRVWSDRNSGNYELLNNLEKCKNVQKKLLRLASECSTQKFRNLHSGYVQILHVVI
jgi:hypothetical protein